MKITQTITTKIRALGRSLGVPQPSFKQRFCLLTNSPLESFERTLFTKCLYGHARLVAPLLLKLKPGIFEEDFAMIQELSTVNSADVFKMEVARFHGRNTRDKNRLRKWFLIRMSGKRLLQWKTKCFPQ